jgi:hypothetical protein
MSARRQRFAKGTPAHDHLGDILAVLDPEQFRHRVVAWVAALTGTSEGVISVDGKTVRRSGQKKAGGNAPIHMVFALAARQRLVHDECRLRITSQPTSAPSSTWPRT